MAEVQTARALPATPGRSWWPFAGAIALAVVVGAGLLGTYGLVVYRLRHSPAGRAAVAQLRASPQLQGLLGEPVRAFIEGGDLQHDGMASFTVRVRGPKGTAQVELDSRAEGHVWRIVSGTVTAPGGREVKLEVTPPAENSKPSAQPVENSGSRGPQP